MILIIFGISEICIYISRISIFFWLSKNIFLLMAIQLRNFFNILSLSFLTDTLMTDQSKTYLAKAFSEFQSGDFSAAENSLKLFLKLVPDSFDGCHLLAIVYAGQGNHLAAIDCYKNALKVIHDDPTVLSNFSSSLNSIGMHEEALHALKKALLVNPNFAEAWFNAGNILCDLGRHEEAIVHYSRAIEINPVFFEAQNNYAKALFDLNRYEESLIHYGNALASNPRFVDCLVNLGASLNELKRFDEAIAHYDRALSLKPDYAEAYFNKGNTLHELKRFDEAIAHYDRALSLKPDYAEVWLNKGEVMNSLKKHAESAHFYLKALEFNLNDYLYLLGKAHHQMMLGCDWTNFENNINKIFHLINEGSMAAEPFGFQGIASSEDLLKKCAEMYSNEKFHALSNLSEFSKYKHNKIRIGYLCGEFRNQATSILLTRVWELHDKSKFEIFAFDNGWDDGSDYRKRIKGAFGDNIFEISRLSDLDAAKLIQFNEIDILINLNGFFGLGRQTVFSYKPAPIQVNYLGFPGTLGASYIDYIIADKVVVPESSKIHYVERLVYLPNSYQANDNQRKISNRTFSRAQLGLPENAFVFACFNNNYKITPSIFDSWMRILTHVRESVLWLLADNPVAKDNLIKEAISRGIDASRLIFAERIPMSDHLARHRQADLFLDTLPYNAHTTTSDALWAGLPVLTLAGHAFPGRVAASLLNAVGLPELITNSQEEYEVLAIDLATNPQKLADIKLKLAGNRLTAPLFNTPLFTKNLEAAYIKMYDRYRADLPPDHIFIESIIS